MTAAASGRPSWSAPSVGTDAEGVAAGGCPGPAPDSTYPLRSFSAISLSTWAVAVSSVLRVLQIVWPVVPIRPYRTTTSRSSRVTSQNFADPPPTNSKLRVLATHEPPARRRKRLLPGRTACDSVQWPPAQPATPPVGTHLPAGQRRNHSDDDRQNPCPHDRTALRTVGHGADRRTATAQQPRTATVPRAARFSCPPRRGLTSQKSRMQPPTELRPQVTRCGWPECPRLTTVAGVSG